MIKWTDIEQDMVGGTAIQARWAGLLLTIFEHGSEGDDPAFLWTVEGVGVPSKQLYSGRGRSVEMSKVAMLSILAEHYVNQYSSYSDDRLIGASVPLSAEAAKELIRDGLVEPQGRDRHLSLFAVKAGAAGDGETSPR